MNQLSRLFTLALIAILATGCAARVTSLNPPPPGTTPMGTWQLTDEDCKSLHDKTILYTAAGAALAVASGGSGLGAGVLAQETPRQVTGGISLGVGVVAAVFAVLQKFATDDFSKGCKVAP